jgi:Fe-S cluster assembly protein SufD
MKFNEKDIIGPNDEFLIVKDGIVTEHSSGISDFLLNKNMNLKVIYFFTRDTKIEFFISEDVKVNITELFFEIGNNCNININYQIGSHSEVRFLSVKNSSENGRLRINTNISLEDEAYIKLNELTSLPGVCELNNHIFLNKPHAKAEINTVTVNSSSQEQLLSINVFHNSKATVSELISYGIASNSSKLMISTDGVIKKGAGKVELRQNTKGLILDLKSHISASPVLEIDDFDVIASHGASIGAIDEEMLYYLMSRGINREDSEKLIISGFINPFLASITEEVLLDWIRSLVNINM